MHKRILVFISFMFMAAGAFAGLTVTPARQEITLVPGEVHEGIYTVRNDYPVPSKIRVEFRDWFVLPENRNVPVSEWLGISPREFSLQPGESREVGYTVRLASAAQGVSVAMVSFIPDVESEQGVTMMVSVSLFVTAAGTEKVSWDIGDITLVNLAAPSVNAVVRNNGNVHLRPRGDVQIFSGGKPVFTADFAEGRPVYPGSYRLLSASGGVKTPLPAGKYTAVVRMQAADQVKSKQVNFRVNKSGEVTVR